MGMQVGVWVIKGLIKKIKRRKKKKIGNYLLLSLSTGGLEGVCQKRRHSRKFCDNQRDHHFLSCTLLLH